MAMKQAALPGPAGKPERNLGIDALRVVSMLLIVVLHVFTRGGAAEQTGGLTTARGIAAFPLRTLCMSAVDVYALISGYVMISGRYRTARLFELWLQVFSIGVVGCLIERFVLRMPVRTEVWLQAFFPVTLWEYWYFSSYVGLFCLIPVLNRGLRAMNRRTLLILMTVLFSVFSGLGILSRVGKHDSFQLISGYSPLWLVVLYVIGACVKRTDLWRETAAWKLWLTVLVCVAACMGLYALLTLPRFPDELLKRSWFDPDRWRVFVLNYVDPLIVVISVCLLALFSRFRPGKGLSAVVRLLSPLTFGIFLIHVHDSSWTLLQGRFQWIGQMRARYIIPTALGVGLAIFLACGVMEWIRAQVFRLLRVRRLCEGLEAALRRFFRKRLKE